jgi:hypothetical protein
MSSSSSSGKLPNTAALLMNRSPRSNSSSSNSLGSLPFESLSSMGTSSSSSTGYVLPNTMKLLRVPATLFSPGPRRRSSSPGPRRRSSSPGSPRRSRSPRSPGSSSPGSPQPPPGWALGSPKFGHRSRSSSGWSSASPVFRRLKFTIKKKGDERATVVRVPRIAPPPAGVLRRRHTYRRPASSSASPVFRRLKFTIKKKGDERATVVRVPMIAPPPAGRLRHRHTYRRPASAPRWSSDDFSPRHAAAARGSPKSASPKGARGSSSSFDSSN